MMRPAWLAVLLAGACACNAAPTPDRAPGQPARPAGAPRLAVEPTEFDFGEVLQHRTLSKEFRIRNFGTGELRLEEITTSCGCTAALPAGRSLAPGGATSLRVTLDTRDDLGRVERSVLIRSNDPQLPIAQLRLVARVQEAAPR